MPQIIPFKGLTYDAGKVRDPAKVVAPPYDVISPEQQNELYDRSPYNIVRLDFSRDPNPYESVPPLFQEWQNWCFYSNKVN